MSDFVNYSKRDVSLPWGWKDLAQVVKAKGLCSAPAPPLGLSQCGIVRPLSEIPKYISLVFDSKEPLSLHIVPVTGKQVELTVANEPVLGLHASVQVRMETETETAVRRFLEVRGFRVPDHSVPPMFSPALPVELCCRIEPLPAEAEMTRLAAALFREVCNLGQHSELRLSLLKWGDSESPEQVFSPGS